MHDGSLATAVQIAKVIREQHDVYERCERISLVSSFSASFFLGHYAPIDHSDGSGMNLMNIHTRQWDPAILRFVAGNNTDDTEYVARRERAREREPSSNRCTDEPRAMMAGLSGFTRSCTILCHRIKRLARSLRHSLIDSASRPSA